MAFDPVSVIGIIGTTLGLLGFVASTAENINLKIKNFEDCCRKLRAYHDTLTQADRELKLWLRLWSKGPNRPGELPHFYEEDIYEFFWGKDGLEEISRRLIDIGEQFKVVDAILQCRSLFLPRHYVDSWNWWLSQQRAAGYPSTNFEHLSWAEKALFAIYRDGAIKSRVEALEKLVSELNRTSESLFRLSHRSRFKVPDPSRVTQLGALHIERRNLVRFMDGLYDANEGATSPDWHLVLDTPALQSALSTLTRESNAPLLIHFCTAKAGEPQLSKTTYSGRMVISDALNQDLEAAASHYPFVHRAALELHRLKPLELSRMTKYTFAARSAACSAVLLYNSAWLRGFCFCGITLCETITQNTEVCFTPGECGHLVNGFSGYTFFLLAIFLAELALGAPLKILKTHRCIDEYEPKFSECFGIPDPLLPPGLENPVSWLTVMEIISDRRQNSTNHTSHGYDAAMAYAFDLGMELMHRDYKSDDIGECINKIVTPLEKQHEILSARLADLQKRKWFRDMEEKRERLDRDTSGEASRS